MAGHPHWRGMTLYARVVQLLLWSLIILVIAPSRIGMVELGLLLGVCLAVILVGLSSVRLILGYIRKSFRR